MFNKLNTIIFLIFRDFSKRKLTFSLVIIALSFNFFNLLVSYSVSRGIQATFATGAKGTFADIYITPPEGKQFLTENESKLKEIFSSIPEIRSYSTHLNIPAAMKFNGHFVNPLYMVGITPNELSTSIIGNDVVEGKFIDFSKDDEIVIGLGLADTLQDFPYDTKSVHSGITVTVVGIDGIEREFKVVGIADTKNFLSNYNFYSTRSAVENILETRGDVSEVIISLKDAKDENLVIQKIKNSGTDAHIGTWQDTSGYIAAFVNVGIGFLLRVMGLISILAGAFITGAILFVHTERKRRQTGILRALGTSKNFITMLYTAEAMTLSILGIILGSIAYALVYNNFISHPVKTIIGDFRPVVDWQLLVVATAIFLVATFIAGFWPAKNSSRERIKKILAER